MARWYVHNTFGTPAALSTSFKTQLAGLAQTATLCRGRIVEIDIGPISVPDATDCNIVWEIQRQSADNGTAGGTLTPSYDDPADSALSARSLWKGNYSAEPTHASTIWRKDINQRGSFIWYAADMEAALKWPATNVNGIACLAKSTNFAGTVGFGVKFDDL